MRFYPALYSFKNSNTSKIIIEDEIMHENKNYSKVIKYPLKFSRTFENAVFSILYYVNTSIY